MFSTKILLIRWALPTLFAIFTFSGASIIFTGQNIWNILLVYGILILLSISSTYFVERLIDFAYPCQKSSDLSYAYLVYGASILYSLLYGPAIFIRFYEYDDWVYQAYKFQDFSWNYLIEPVNDHYVPLLRLLLYVIGAISDPHFFGYSVALYLAGLLVLSAFARVVKVHINGKISLLVIVLAFAVWPSFETARTWFGGGFWLAIPVGFFLICLLVINRIVSGKETRSSWIILGFSGLATVTSSSQIMIPSLYIGVYLFTLVLCEKPERRTELVVRSWKILALLILPTIFVLYLRSGHLSHQLDFSGIWNGGYLRGIGAFLSVKVLNVHRWYLFWPYCTAIISISIIVFLWALLAYRKTRSSDFNQNETQIPGQTFAFALVGCGLSMYLFFFLQVGLGRSWEVYAAINAYYATFPLTAIALTVAGATQIKLLQFWRSSQLISACIFMCGLAIVIYSVVISAKKYFPTEDYIQGVENQKKFIGLFGEAVCDYLDKTKVTGIVFLRQAQPYLECKECELLLRGPKSFLEHISQSDKFTPILAKSLAQHQCPDLANRLALNPEEAKWFSDGIQHSEKMRQFYKQYFSLISE